MEIESAFLHGKLHSRLKEKLVATVNWIIAGILIAWIAFCLAVSAVTFLTGILAGEDGPRL